GGKANDSMPQGVVTGAGKYNVGRSIFENCVSCFLTTAGGNTEVGEIRCINSTDNGIYGLGGDLKVGDFYYESIGDTGDEEPVVASNVDSLYIDSVTIVGRCSGVLNYENSGRIVINNVNLQADVPQDAADFGSHVTTTLLSARNGNTTLGTDYISMNNVTGFCQIGIRTNSGRLRELNIRNVDVTFCRYPTGSPLNQWPVNPTNFNVWDTRGCDRVDLRDITLTFKNFEVTTWPSGIISFFNHVFTEMSYIENLEVRAAELDNSIADPALQIRLGAPQQFLKFQDMYVDIVGGGNFQAVRVREGLYQKNSVPSVPTDGYFEVGQVLFNNSGSADVAYVCTVAGDPATFVTK
ncbi:MAG: hypothetical protein QF704_13175, partial [Anaerolineales bacterium]|nr:hypothetical protein [Anaerolineales bacterium]